MQCIRCKGTKKLWQVSAKCSDMCNTDHIGGLSHNGYVPEWLGPNGYGDYIEFTICRHCGQVQGDWPELDKTINQFKSGKVS